jgi:hypothetical protein
MASSYSRALTDYATTVSGVNVSVLQGEVRLGSDPVVTANAALWENLDTAGARGGYRMTTGAIGGQ